MARPRRRNRPGRPGPGRPGPGPGRPGPGPGRPGPGPGRPGPGPGRPGPGRPGRFRRRGRAIAVADEPGHDPAATSPLKIDQISGLQSLVISVFAQVLMFPLTAVTLANERLARDNCTGKGAVDDPHHGLGLTPPPPGCGAWARPGGESPCAETRGERL